MNFREAETIRDFQYPVSCVDMSLTEDRRYLLSAGVYKPSIRIYDLDNLSLKAERHLEADPVCIVPLSEDFSKLCVLRCDRMVEFHAKYGHHESVRLPSVCFDLCFNKFRAEIAAGGRGREVYRFNLEQGRFLKSYYTGLEEVRSIEMSVASGLVAVGGDCRIEFIDQRSREVVRAADYEESPTCMAFSENGVDFGVGTSEGAVFFHDLRARKELFRNEHSTGIRRVLFNGKTLVSADSRAVRFCSRGGELGELVEKNINCIESDGGVVFLGLDSGAMKTVLSAELGETPSWCRLLEE